MLNYRLEYPMLTAFFKDERGATSIEYSLIAILISITILASFAVLSGEVERLLGKPADHLK